MDNQKEKRVISRNGRGEYEEKKSRFIGGAYSISSQEEAEQIIDKIVKEYWDARHHCYAYVLGDNNEVTRCCDNGEPSGTAGRPILDVLTGSGVRNAMIVVTRYFGGTLLGTGGLVRAYSQAAKSALEDSEISVLRQGSVIGITVAYNAYDKILHSLTQMELEAKEPVYTDNISFDVIVTSDKEDILIKNVTGITGGKAVIVKKEEGFYPCKN